MIRLLFIPIFVLLLFSCNDSLKEVDPLFYQISEVDSIRCMDEILDGIVFDANENQRKEDELYNSANFIPPPSCFPVSYFSVSINSKGSLMINSSFDSTALAEKVYYYFMCNRNLSSKETVVAATNPNHFGFEFPFYNNYKIAEIERYIEETTEEWEEWNKSDVEPELLEYYWSEVEVWQKQKNILLLIGDEFLTKNARSEYVRIEYQKSSVKLSNVTRDVALAFYQMRNYECLRYFKETYLSLYERYKRLSIPLDVEKLESLKYLHPALIYFRDRSEPSKYRVIPEPVLQHEEFTP